MLGIAFNALSISKSRFLKMLFTFLVKLSNEILFQAYFYSTSVFRCIFSFALPRGHGLFHINLENYLCIENGRLHCTAL